MDTLVEALQSLGLSDGVLLLHRSQLHDDKLSTGMDSNYFI